MLEREVQRDIQLKTAHLVGWFRNSVGVAEIGGRLVAFGIGGKGGADLIGVRRRDGRFVAVEVKAQGKKPRPEQLAFLEMIRRCNGIALWADNAADVLQAVETL